MAREWRRYKNSRGYMVTRCEGEHVSLFDLKMDPTLDNRYLRKRNIPPYPEPVVFHVPNVKHVTDERGRQGIFKDGGFRIQQYEKNDNFLCFSLSVSEENIAEAENNFLEEIYPDGWNQEESFLEDFTTSPAFQSESRYGNFCFTFSLSELLHRYACQFCGHTAPVFRVLATELYQQEIVYSVLVHPRHIDRYNHYRRLPRGDEDVCGYFQGQMSWSCQAPSCAHGYRFTVDEEEGTVYGKRLRGEEYYVWDHVTVAFYMEPQWVLRVNRQRLSNSMTVCKVSQRNLVRDPDAQHSALNEGCKEVEEILEDLYRLWLVQGCLVGNGGTMAAHREWIGSKNSRGIDFTYCEGEHVSISELKEDPCIDQNYLRNTNIPPYPESIFHVSKACHVTGVNGLWNIFNDGGFRKPQFLDGSLLWWSLSVTKDEIADAEKNILKKIFPAGHADKHQPFLENFTTSPAFQSKSRYGNFRFTFPLKELLHLYAEQFCRGSALVLRVFDTAIYKKEILYTVLVHPQHINRYDKYKLLPSDDSGVCGYSQGKISWRCQSPTDSFRHQMVVDREQCRVHAKPLQRDKVYYRWDHVAVAFHVEPDWVLRVDRNQLSSSLSVCEVAEINLLKKPDTPLSEPQARAVLEDVRRQYGLGLVQP